MLIHQKDQLQLRRQQVREILENRLHNAACIVVLGVGNDLRGDDAAGVLVARRISALQPNERLIALDCGAAPENFTGEVIRLKPSHILLIDTAEMRLEPGSLQVIEPSAIANAEFSTHSLPHAITVAYLTKSIEAQITILGIQPKQLQFMAPLTTAVETSIEALVQELNSYSS